MIRELKPEELRLRIDPASFEAETSEELRPDVGLIGQTRATRALRFGLDIADNGFNIYVAGPPGIGKMTAVQAFVEETAKSHPAASDWCYVNNFEDPYRPRVCRLPAGMGKQLRNDMDELIDHLRRQIPKTFESEDYTAKRDEILAAIGRQRGEVLEKLRKKAEGSGFLLEATPMGIVLVPSVEGKPLTEEAFEALTDHAKRDMGRRRAGLEGALKTSLREVRDLERTAKEQVRALRNRVALFLVGGLIDDLVEKYAELPDVVAYLKAVQTDIVDNIDTFRPQPSGEEAVGMLLMRHLRESPFRKYQVNVLVEAAPEGAPVVVELNPTYSNLFGRIDKEAELGAVYTDFTMIRSGSLHRANEGFLVLPTEEALREPFCWDGLKRALKSRELTVEDPADRLGISSTRGLRPEPVPLDVKVVLVGRTLWFHLLHAYDESFPELFKVNADFDTIMDRTPEAQQEFLRFLGDLCRKEKICHLDRGAMARILEHAIRMADDRQKISTRLGQIADVVREAHFWSHKDESPTIGVQHVRKALDETVYRSAMIRDRIQEMIRRGFLLVDTKGATVGQVNGLSVLGIGTQTFGRPSRITASVAPGRDGLVDIEREVALGGPIHSKGVLILGGFLAQRYARSHPLSLAARLVFEQSYDGVEGDSASSTELYALLSALSELPIRQGVAVTGSVNQRGEVQAIGGVNEKIEGYFEVCRESGFGGGPGGGVGGGAGGPGVMIPSSNVANLMLREDVVEAVEKGLFHVWSVDTIDDGIEVLTGVSAGARGLDPGSDGAFPEGSVNARVAARLKRFAESMRPVAAKASGKKEKETPEPVA